MPLNLPEGWDFDLVFGGNPAGENRPTQTPEQRRAQKAEQQRIAALPIAVSAQPRTVQPGPAKVMLPRTATDAELKLWFGFALLMISLLLIGLGRGIVRFAR